MTPEREEKIRKVLDKRQNDLTVVLENVFDPHNISAVMRTCDAVGIQEIYVLTTRIPRHKKWGSRSSSSAAKWLTIRQYSDAAVCFGDIRTRYGRVLTSWLGEGVANLYELNLTEPIALVFGNEHEGVSPEIRALSDGDFLIPQCGMIQSLNISVACAVTLYEAFRQKERAGQYAAPKLDPRQRQVLERTWGNP